MTAKTSLQLQNNYWLKQHQITAFWHSFGLSNGLRVPLENTRYEYTNKNGRYKSEAVKDGKTYVVVTPEFMQEVLKDYLSNLETYAESWDTTKHDFVHNSKLVDNVETFLESEELHKESRANILKMIDLLQKCAV